MKLRSILAGALVVALALSSVSVASAGPGMADIRKGSVAFLYSPVNASCWSPDMSATGRFVAYETAAGNLTSGSDSNGVYDVYLYDNTLPVPRRVSVSSSGTQGNGDSDAAAISADGSHIAFESSADNLVGGDTNGMRDVFVRDTGAGTTTRVSVSMDEQQALSASWDPSISENGRYVAFTSAEDDLVGNDAHAGTDVFVRDTWAGNTEMISRTWNNGSPDGISDRAVISGNGRYVAFMSAATNIVPGDTNGVNDVFVRDRWLRTTERVSVSSSEVQTLSHVSRVVDITPDGRYVLFDSSGGDLVTGDTDGGKDVFVRDRWAGTTECVSLSWADLMVAGECMGGSISADGSKVAFESADNNLVLLDTNAQSDVFVRTRAAGTTSRVSNTRTGTQAQEPSYYPSLSNDGREMAFSSEEEMIGETAETNANIYWRRLFEGSARTYASYSGDNRYETCVKMSQAAFAKGSQFVVIATGENWPDALGGAALAGALDAPILLTNKGSLPPAIATEITRLKPEIAYVLGGEGAVSRQVYQQLQVKVGSEDVIRLGGTNRYLTAERIAGEARKVLGGGFDGTCLLATGANFPDALAGSPVAAVKGWPVLLTPTTGLLATTKAKFASLGAKKVLILGGSKAVPNSAQTALAAYSPVRLAGEGRYETARKIAEYGVKNGGLVWDNVAFATGANFPDALAGGVLQGKSTSVLLLTPTASLNATAKGALTANVSAIDNLRFLGGTSALSTATRTQVKAALGD